METPEWPRTCSAIPAAGLDRLRVDTIADLATLREVPKASDEPQPTVWWLTAEEDDASHPLLVLGIRGDVGFLHWYGDPDINQVPVGTEYRDGSTHDYFRSGADHAAVIGTGEEIPAASVYQAAVQFVATGKRPPCVQWMNEADVPDHRPPASALEDSAAYRAIKAAAESEPTAP